MFEVDQLDSNRAFEIEAIARYLYTKSTYKSCAKFIIQAPLNESKDLICNLTHQIIKNLPLGYFVYFDFKNEEYVLRKIMTDERNINRSPRVGHGLPIKTVDKSSCIKTLVKTAILTFKQDNKFWFLANKKL